LTIFILLLQPVVHRILATDDELEELGHLHVDPRRDGDERAGRRLVVAVLGDAAI
jgi:hypothetical protein